MQIRPDQTSGYSYSFKRGKVGKQGDPYQVRESVTLGSDIETSPDMKTMSAAVKNKESWGGEESGNKTSWLSSLGRKTGWLLAGIALIGSVGLVGCSPGTGSTEANQKEETPIERTVEETEEKAPEAGTENIQKEGEKGGSIIDYLTPEGRKTLKDWAKKAGEVVKNPGEAIHQAKEIAKEAAKGNLEEAKDRAVKEAKEFLEKDSKEAVEAAKKVVEGDKSELKENVQELIEKGKEYGQKKLDQAKDTADEAGKIAKDAGETLSEVREGFKEGGAENKTQENK